MTDREDGAAGAGARGHERHAGRVDSDRSGLDAVAHQHQRRQPDGTGGIRHHLLPDRDRLVTGRDDGRHGLAAGTAGHHLARRPRVAGVVAVRHHDIADRPRRAGLDFGVDDGRQRHVPTAEPHDPTEAPVGTRGASRSSTTSTPRSSMPTPRSVVVQRSEPSAPSTTHGNVAIPAARPRSSSGTTATGRAWPGGAPDVGTIAASSSRSVVQRDHGRGGRRDATGLGDGDDDVTTGRPRGAEGRRTACRRAVAARPAGRRPGPGRGTRTARRLLPRATRRPRRRSRWCRTPARGPARRPAGGSRRGRSTPRRPATARRLPWHMTPPRSRRAGRRSRRGRVLPASPRTWPRRPRSARRSTRSPPCPPRSRRCRPPPRRPAAAS